MKTRPFPRIRWMPLLVSAGPFACAVQAPGTASRNGSADGGTCLENTTAPCECQSGAKGRAVCVAATWASCECARIPAPAPTVAPMDASSDAVVATLGDDRTDITFDWTRTTADGLTCEAGHYEGSFAGLYYSSLNWPAPFPVTGVDLPGHPGLQFDVLPAAAGEHTLKVQGKFDGLADGAFPFQGDFVGTLDCAKAKFVGMMLNAKYAIGPKDLVVIQNPVQFGFEGPVTADYDKRTHSFVNGRWDAFESKFNGKPAASWPRDPLRDGVGGSGVWSAGWIGAPVAYKCPATDGNGLPLACQPGPFGLTKTFCVYPTLVPGVRADAPSCEADADCAKDFPGQVVPCTDVNGDGLVKRCLQECTP